MGNDGRDLKSMTRMLLMGAALGAMPLLSACVPPMGSMAITQVEQQRFSVAVNSRNPRTVTAFLRDFPQSPLVPALLESQPTRVLNQIPSSALAGLPSSTVSSLSPRVMAQLSLLGPSVRASASPFPTTTPTPVTAYGTGGGGRY